MLALTHDEAMTVVKTKAAIAAMNDLVIHLVDHPNILPEAVKVRILEADYLLNSAEDYFINDDPEMMETMRRHTCRYCGRGIVKVGDGWIDPEATGDDAVWRETCGEHDSFVAEHLPKEEA